MSNCDFCGLEVSLLNRHGHDVVIYNCKRCGHIEMSSILSSMLINNREYDKYKTILSGIMRYRKDNELPNVLITSSNILELCDSFFVPRNLSQKLDLIIKYISKRTDFFGKPVNLDINMDYPIAFCKNSLEFINLLDLLENQKLLKSPEKGKVYILTFEGMNRVDEIERKIIKKRQVFVAMWFNDSMSEVYDNGFHKAIFDCGYDPLKINLKEHNNKIDDEIVAEIRNSGFLIADMTAQRGGVYFEAGFAHGLGIPVIWTCKKEDICNLHFDIRQFNHIEWNTSEELYGKLVRRIKATITI